jgi:predicted transposase YdaD
VLYGRHGPGSPQLRIATSFHFQIDTPRQLFFLVDDSSRGLDLHPAIDQGRAMSKPARGEMSPQPHDALFRFAFTQREHAAGLLKAVLPEALVRAVDFRTLRVEKGSFVDRALRSRHTDLVLSARLRGRPVYFYVLIEQQRDVEALMVFRMGIYMMRLWEHLVRDDPTIKELPPILPLLVHHSDTGWTAATALQDIVAAEGEERRALLPYIPHFELRLVDLSAGQASGLVDQVLTAFGQVVLWCLSVAGDDARLWAEFGRISAALEEVLRAPNGLAALEALLRYLVATHRRLSVKKLGKLLEKAGPRTKEGVVTVLDEIELRGELKGERKGRAKMLLQQLAARFGEVPAKVIARVEAADEGALDRWAVRVLTAKTPEDAIDDGEGTGRRPPSTPRSAARKGAQRASGARRAS